MTSRPIVIKKYGNRRLYDTAESRYITLAELEEMIRRGAEVRVVDSKSGEDLTQATLVQVILDGRRATELLPVALLTQLIRLGDEALAEFLGRTMSWALDVFLQARHGAQQLVPYNPLASLPFDGATGFARMWNRATDWTRPAEPPPAERNDVAELRREIEELKSSLGRGRRRRR
jgi:polyhydroxyalkanoate synthesis repressor PhaR